MTAQDRTVEVLEDDLRKQVTDLESERTVLAGICERAESLNNKCKYLVYSHQFRPPGTVLQVLQVLYCTVSGTDGPVQEWRRWPG